MTQTTLTRAAVDERGLIEMTPGEVLAELAKRPLGGHGRNSAGAWDAVWWIADHADQWDEDVWIDTAEHGERVACFETWAVIRAGVPVTADGRVRLREIRACWLRLEVEDQCVERRDAEEDVPDSLPVSRVAMVVLGIDERGMSQLARCRDLDALLFAVRRLFGPCPVALRPDLLVHWRNHVGVVACGEPDEPRMTSDARAVTCDGCQERMAHATSRLAAALAAHAIVEGARA